MHVHNMQEDIQSNTTSCSYCMGMDMESYTVHIMVYVRSFVGATSDEYTIFLPIYSTSLPVWSHCRCSCISQFPF